MNNILKVAKNEYTQHVLTKRFWIALIGVPLIFVLFGAFSAIVGVKSVDTRPIAIVDQAGIITQAQNLEGKGGFFDVSIEFPTFKDVEAPKAATEANTLQGYVVIPKDYLEHYTLDWYGNKQINPEAQKELSAYISQNLLADETIPNQARIAAGSKIRIESLDGSVQSSGDSWHRILVPALTGLLYFILVMGSGSYLLQSLVGEKENRTIEILLTSVSPNEMMAGKIIGNIGVAITQLVVWVAIVMVGLLAFQSKLSFLSDIQISWPILGINLVFLMVSFIFTASLLAIFGATMTETQEAQSAMGLIVFPVMIPFYFFVVIMNAPNGLFARVLSYIPFSNPLTMGLRMAFTRVATWEILLVLTVQIIIAVLTIWLAGKAFKVGMLQFTEKVSLFSLLKKEARDA
jgi:ABC-2 type transport system permease protein